MGYLTAIVFKETMPLEEALYYHLRCNCYPPIKSRVGKEAAMEAVRKANEGRFDGMITLRYDGGETREISTTEVIEDLHLDPFIDY